MAIYNTPDGRQVVGSVESGNDYHGFNGKRDIIIQLTADGATTDGLNALEYLKAYAVEQNKQNKPIFPNGTRVFISANGYTKAVEADDIVIDGDNITIGGIVWNGSTWDYTNAGQSGGGGLPPVTESDAGKVLAVDNSGVWGASLNQVEILADYNPATGIMAQRQGADVPTAYELYTAFACNGTVKMRVFVDNHQLGAIYLYPFGNEADGLLFGTVLRNKSADYNESINVLFSVDDDDVVAFAVYRSVTPKGRFIVTLTPTAADYSGTMDKTAAEIDAAYKAGQQIVFRIYGSPTLYYDINATLSSKANSDDVPSFVGYGILTGQFIVFETTANTQVSTYSTKIYILTPAT